MGAWEDGFAAGWKAASSDIFATRRGGGSSPERAMKRARSSSKPKRKASAYSKRYGTAFKRLAKKNKKKSGGWKQGGFARTQKAAHKAAKK